MLCLDLSQTCGPPQATEDTGEFSFTLQPPNWFQNDLNPTGTFALLDKDRMHKDTVGDNLALPTESVCVKKVKLKKVKTIYGWSHQGTQLKSC